MNKTIIALITYIFAIGYFITSDKSLYIYTLKYYSLLRYITDDKSSIIALNDNFIKYRYIIRYLRIHVIASSIIVTINIFINLQLLMQIIQVSYFGLAVIIIIDKITIKTRLISLEDKIYKIYNCTNKEKK